MKYREYEKPIPVMFYTLDGLGSGAAVGVREKEMPNGKSQFHFLVMTDDGPIMVGQRDILPERR